MNVERFARLVLGLSALAFAGIGAAFLVVPEAMAARVGVSLAGAAAANDVRAVYGESRPSCSTAPGGQTW